MRGARSKMIKDAYQDLSERTAPNEKNKPSLRLRVHNFFHSGCSGWYALGIITVAVSALAYSAHDEIGKRSKNQTLVNRVLQRAEGYDGKPGISQEDQIRLYKEITGKPLYDGVDIQLEASPNHIYVRTARKNNLSLDDIDVIKPEVLENSLNQPIQAPQEKK